MRKFLLICAIAAVAAFGQQPAFEVASIRSAAQITPDMITSGKLHVGMKIDAARVDIGYLSLRDLATMAYEVKPFQVTAPDWMAAQRFDILAKMPDGATKEQVPAMLRALLEERFKLVAHRENKEQPVYSLEVGKNGPKFKEAPPAETVSPKPEGKADLVLGAGDQQVRINRTGGGPGGTQMTMSSPESGTTKVSVGPDGQMHMEIERMTMATLAQTLTPMLDRPVIDHTELKGAFTIALDLSIQDMMQMARTAGASVPVMSVPLGGPAGGPAIAASDPSGGTIFTSVQKLGLKLEKQKEPIETIVVESAEKNPTEN
ncbi:MAG: TIGR03435 family protein [Acidobacteriia bacterium]|nr:TIGR03435 family protein [Terriglobia bacterium]